MYALGIDLGTTFTAAAVWRNGRAEIAALGSRAAAIPSVVLLREDETFLTGETANRRALTEPGRVAREFKRRLGDTTPLLLGGAPYSAEALMARLLRSVINEVSAREGGQAALICVCHPANWGPYKTDLLRQAVRMADLEQPVTLVTEPEAAAVFYAQQQRIEPGAVVAVYDLGGGTFDAAVLRKTQHGFEILGQPEGIERLGGIDFDAAVFSHVSRVLGSQLAELDEDSPAAIAAVARLREECTEAKEALSSDTDVSIPVLLPNVSTEVRLTRAELETMVRPALHDSIEALKRAIRSAGVTPEQLHSVLLVGGSSRMPIVGQLVGAELGRPVAVDAHPKHAVALGAAFVASAAPAAAAAAAAGPPSRPTPAVGPPSHPTPAVRPEPGPYAQPTNRPDPAGRPAGRGQTPAPLPPPPPARPDVPARLGPPSHPVPAARPDSAPYPAPPGRLDPAAQQGGPTRQDSPPRLGHPSRPVPAVHPEPAGYPDATGRLDPPGRLPPASRAGAASRQPGYFPLSQSGAGGQRGGGEADATELLTRMARSSAPPPPPAGGGPGRFSGSAGGPTERRRMLPVVIAFLLAAALAAVGGVLFAKRNQDGLTPANASGSRPASQPNHTAAQTGHSNPPSTAGSTEPTTSLSADEQCTSQIKANKRWVCLTKATFDGNKLTIDYQASFNGVAPDVTGGFHLHIYGADETGSNPPEGVEGSQSATPGRWYVEDQNPSVRLASGNDFKKAIGSDAKKVCARIASSHHELVPDNDGGFHTGNCVPIQRV
jgi:actin-like ATPase involved in cell morphogenesis